MDFVLDVWLELGKIFLISLSFLVAKVRTHCTLKLR